MVDTLDLSLDASDIASGFTIEESGSMNNDPSGFRNGLVGFQESAWLIKLPRKPASVVIGAMFSRY